jgi:hypothetical protein
MQGLRTTLMSQSRESTGSLSRTHRDNISLGEIHSRIVLVCPFETNIDPAFESRVLLSESFPRGHKHLKRRD